MSHAYDGPLVQALVTTLLVDAVSAKLFADLGGQFQLLCRCAAGLFWVTALAVIGRHRRTPTRAGVLFVRWGLLLFFSALTASAIAGLPPVGLLL